MVCPQGKESIGVETVVNHLSDLCFALIDADVALAMVVISHTSDKTVGIFLDQSPDVVAIEDGIDYLKALRY